MKILVDEMPKKPMDCSFALFPDGTPQWTCLLNNGGKGVCCLEFSWLCPYLKRKRW